MEFTKTYFNLNKDLCKQLLDVLLSTGAEFAEVFMEETVNDNIKCVNGEIDTITYNSVCGASIRIIKDENQYSSALSDPNFDKLLKACKDLAMMCDGKKTTEVLEFVEKESTGICRPQRIYSKNNSEEIALLKKAYKAAKEADKQIVQVTTNMVRKVQRIFVFASDSTYQPDLRCNVRITVASVASDNGQMHQCHNSYGSTSGLEMYDNYDLQGLAKLVSLNAVEMLHAEPMVGGEMPVVINNGFGGVILHEACVHGLEATSVGPGNSVFCGKLGTKVASDIVNAVDDGTNYNEWGSINFDDEGTPSQCNVLIENGVLKSYLVDKGHSKGMKHHITGSSRRESYRYNTTSRMTNTYFLNGTSKFEDIIKNTKYGLFAKEMGGGSVNPATGEFNFAVNVGYLIEDGKITKPVKGATLIGSGKDILFNIDMIADNLELAQGVCGSYSGSVFTSVGQPTIRVSKILVGGAGGKN